jgi:AraC family transcriptional regulator, transcriptional activator of pobA
MTQTSFTLVDPQTKDLAFKVSSFEDNSDFNSLKRYNYFSMVLVTKGRGRLVRDETEYEFSKSCLICFAIYQPFIIEPADEFEGILINFHPGFFCLFKHRTEVSCNGVLFNNIYDTPVVNLNSSQIHSLSTIAGQLKTEMQNRELPDQEVLISYLKIFLIDAARIKIEQRKPKETEPGKEPAIAAILKKAIEENFKTLRSPGDYAALVHISIKALNKASKSYFNKTLTNLIAERMIIEAKRELYLTAKSVKQIAFELGYIDEFYFSRYFKKNVGVSPRIFRDTVGFDKLNA